MVAAVAAGGVGAGGTLSASDTGIEREGGHYYKSRRMRMRDASGN